MGVGAAVLALCVIYTGYTLWKGQQAKYVRAGYEQALVDLVAASESQREINVTVGEKTVKFVIVQPASLAP